MRILQLTPGSGDNFYCESCLRDISLVRSLRALGHEVTLVPMYLPLQIKNPEPLESAPIFFGKINVYLQQKLPFLRWTPGWLDRWLDSPILLRKIAKYSSMTHTHDLGETTISILAGNNGRQAKEISRLADWLESHAEKPDVIVLSNVLLSGLAGPLVKRLARPVACLLQDEDRFLNGLGQPWPEQAWRQIRANADYIDHFIAVSRYYREIMVERIGVAESKVSVVYTGLDTTAFAPPEELPENPTIGYLSRICHDNGLDILVNALFMLRRDERFSKAKLMVTGGYLSSDKIFLQKVKRRIASQHLTEWVIFEDDYSQQTRKKFLNRLSVVCVPARKPMAYGLFALEAMACGVPFVQPEAGVFCELAEYGAGALYEPNNPVKLAEMLRTVMTDAQRLASMRIAARKTAENVFAIDKTAVNLVSTIKDQK